MTFQYPSDAGPSHAHQKTRFAPSRFQSFVTSIKHHLTPPSHPSTTSESANDSSFKHDNDLFYSESLPGGSHLPLELLNPKLGTTSKYKRRSKGRKPKSSAGHSNSRYGDDEDNNAAHEPISHIVVEANFDHFTPPAPKSDSGSTNRTPGHTQPSLRMRSNEREDDDDEEAEADYGGLEKSEVHSIRTDQRRSWIRRTPVWEFVVERLWPNVKHFMDSSYPEAAKERSFQKEVGDLSWTDLMCSTGSVRNRGLWLRHHIW
jgi:hypothetical protein